MHDKRVCGVDNSGCLLQDYHCILLTDCTSEPIAWDASRSNHDASITLVQILFGWTSTSDHFLKAIDERDQGRLETGT
ncbi:hypothetical protein N181_13685 [Sinorhizobium fredii USDA 205]|nr:hypothetical protein N181_13685 [Sinorhizobium fredii USDA 205]